MTHQERILVVEDEPLVSETIENALLESWPVMVADCSEDAVQALRAGPFAAVLLDCLLPGGKAADVLAEADRHQVPVILMSGAPEQIEALAGGRRPFLSKPFTIQDLMETVRSLLSRSADPADRPQNSGGSQD